MDFSILEQHLGVKFKDRSFLKQALTHRSYPNENRAWPLGHNERLEFLGDAILELIVREFLFRKYPAKREGVLTAYAMGLVNGQVLSEVAVELNLGDFILISRGQAKETATSPAREVILGDAFEAVIAAIYLDQGFEVAQEFVTRTLLPRTDEIVEKELWRSYKTTLQEATREHLKIEPRYEVFEVSGPEHNRQFIVGVYFGSDLMANGRGRSKQRAEEEAAKGALALKGWNSSPA